MPLGVPSEEGGGGEVIAPVRAPGEKMGKDRNLERHPKIAAALMLPSLCHHNPFSTKIALWLLPGPSIS